MTWSGPGTQVRFALGSSPAYHIENLELMRPVYQKVIRYAQAMGLDMIEADYEDPGQVEMNWMFDDADLTADRLITYRSICKQVARELGLEASFMPKAVDRSDGQRLPPQSEFVGRRRERSGGAEPAGVAPDGRRFERPRRHSEPRCRIHADHGPDGQLLQALLGLRAVRAITDQLGMDNKTCTVRLSANGRLEYKLPDASVNPYLSHAALLAAIEDGLNNKIDPGEPTAGSSYDGGIEMFEPLPLTLVEAVRAFEKDDVVRASMPGRWRICYWTSNATSGRGSAHSSPTGSTNATGRRSRERGPEARVYRHRSPAAVPQEPRWHRARGVRTRRGEGARRTDGSGASVGDHAVVADAARCAAARGGRGSMWSGIIASREEQVDFTRPYGVFHEGVLVRSGSGITSPADLVGRKVAAIADSANMALLLSFEGAIPVPFGGDSDDVFAEMLGALDAGEVDAVVDDDVVFVPLDDDPRYEQAFTVKTGNRWGIGVAKDRPELLAEIDSALAAVIANGQLAQVWHTWLPSLEFPLGRQSSMTLDL